MCLEFDVEGFRVSPVNLNFLTIQQLHVVMNTHIQQLQVVMNTHIQQLQVVINTHIQQLHVVIKWTHAFNNYM